MKVRKYIRTMGYLEIILAVILCCLAVVQLIGKSADIKAAMDKGWFFAALILVPALAIPVVYLLGGLIGIIARGKKVLLTMGIIMLIAAFPGIIANKAMDKLPTKLALVFYVVCALVSLLYLVGALLYRKPPKRGEGPGEFPPMPPMPPAQPRD